MLLRLIITLALLARSSSAAVDPKCWGCTEKDQISGVPKAPYIFNSVHDSLRLAGNALHHNGMAIFLATIPAGKEVYHGTGESSPIEGMEWVAMEPEGALGFAHPKIRRPQPQEKRPAVSDGDAPGKQAFLRLQDRSEAQKGYLHVYRTTAPLRMLYLDGQSAAKSTLGTLDTQDLVLRNATKLSSSPMSGDYARYEELCGKAKGEWNQSIDGFIRMVGGFEAVLCSFSDTLTIIDILAVETDRSHLLEAPLHSSSEDAGRMGISLNFQSMIHLMAFPEATYVDINGMPRVRNDSATVLRARAALDNLVASVDMAEATSRDWRAVTDSYVSRWSDRIALLNSGEDVPTLLRSSTAPYINFAHRNRSEESKRCVLQYWPSGAHRDESIASQAVWTVASRICHDILMCRDEKTGNSSAQEVLRDLQLWLDWTTWRECRGCSPGEICRLPIWPSGTRAELEHPFCDTHSGKGHGQGDYWDMSPI